jgi:MFS family permease
MKKDLWKIYFLAFVSNLMFFLPVVYIYYLDIGFNFSQIFMLEGVFSFGFLVFLLPFGALADYIGRKKVLIFNAIIGVICNLVYFYSENFVIYLITQFVWSVVFIGSISKAFMFDFLHKNKKSKEYKKYQGMFFFFALLGSAVAALIGGYVSKFSLKLPFLLSTFSHILAIFALFSIEHKEKRGVNKNYFLILKESFVQIKQSNWIKWLVAYYAVTGIVFRLFYPLVQPFMQRSGLDIALFGVATTFFFMVGSITGKFVDPIEKKFKDWIYLVSGIGYIIPIFFMAFFSPVWGFITVGAIFFGGVVTQVVFEHEILSITKKRLHATIISFSELGYRGVVALIAPVFGIYLSRVGEQKTLLTLGTVSLFLIPIFAWFFVRVKKKEK